MTSPYETNFHSEKSGNALHKGNDLTITINDDPSYVAGVLYKKLSFRRKKLIQIEQSNHKGNPSKNSITFEMSNPDGSRYERGKYRVKTGASFGYHSSTRTGDLSWGDDFEIV